MENIFTNNIIKILEKNFDDKAQEIFDKSNLLQYINFKTKSANKGAKSRASFANIYAIYVIIEDYINNGFDTRNDYAKYEGVSFTKLFQRQRQLPFGNKLQNHALNNRVNSEFQKFFPASEFIPIIRNLESNRYWINESLLNIKLGKTVFNIGKSILEIIDSYIVNKKVAFDDFISYCESLKHVNKKSHAEMINFIKGLLADNMDARIFEIVSYAILKYFYYNQNIFWGFNLKQINKENLKLYKTGRTNANDGGIDFVMKPLGRFFQVTETIDVKKYFLDIDKIERYPITFIIKSNLKVTELKNKLKEKAKYWYSIDEVVSKYMNCIEEIINIPELIQIFENTINSGYLENILDEIIIQSKVEFNYE